MPSRAQSQPVQLIRPKSTSTCTFIVSVVGMEKSPSMGGLWKRTPTDTRGGLARVKDAKNAKLGGRQLYDMCTVRARSQHVPINSWNVGIANRIESRQVHMSMRMTIRVPPVQPSRFSA